ncbi:hypothetical protein HIR72_01765 [Pasteurella multocida]|uniref:hypothetical protein n=1 Tax=Pasteurella multocida TaxID=747 RepID=UPI0014615C88|nr:hypothetical protein [Pasteurella multocida]NMR59428.1 hypothetical protein [Pasteurella multocida]
MAQKEKGEEAGRERLVEGDGTKEVITGKKEAKKKVDEKNLKNKPYKKEERKER